MKKSKLIIALVTPLLLAGCGSSKVGFQEDLKFEKELSSAESAYVLAKVKDKLVESGKKVSIKSEGFEIEGHNRTDQKGEMVFEIFNDYYAYSEVKTEVTEKTDGIVKTLKGSVKDEMFDDAEHNTFIGMKSTEGDPFDTEKGFSYQTMNYGAEYAERARKEFNEIAIMTSDLAMMLFGGGYMGFAVKGGSYAFVASQINDTRTDVAYGNGLREHIVIERYQTILNVNKKFEITKMTSYMDAIDNQDPMTGEWFDKEKTMEQLTSTGTITYGKRSGSGKKLAQALEIMKKPVLVNEGLTLCKGTYNSETNIFAPGSVVAPDSFVTEQLSIDRRHVEAVYNVTDTNAFYLYNVAQRRSNYTADLANDEQYMTLQDVQNVQTADSQNVILIEKDIQLVLSFDVVSTESGIVFENLEQHIF